MHRFLALIVVAIALSGCMGGSKGDPQGTGESHSTSADLRAEFEFAPRSPKVGEAVQFRDLSAGKVVSHAWDFGDSTGSTDAEPFHIFGAAAAYRVTLRVKDAEGNEADVVHLVPVGKALNGDGGNETVTPPDRMVFQAPVTVRSSGGGEPSLAIDKNGVFYVSPPGSLYKSTDGKAFTAVTYPRVVSGDSHVVTDLDGRVWISDLQGFGLGAGVAVVPVLGPSSVWSSTDAGATWTTGSPAASLTPFNDRQWLAVTAGGTGYLLYRSCTVALPIGCFSVGSLLTKTTDGGRTWVLLSGTFEWTSFPFADPKDGALYIVESTESGIRVAVSTNGGSSFTRTTVATRRTPTDESFVNGAVDDAGNVYIAWSDADRGQTDVYMAYSTNKGQSWRGPFLASSGVGTHIFPWIAAGRDGKVAVAWYGTEVKGDPNQLAGDTKWYVNVAHSLNAHDAQPVFAQGRVTADPIHIGAVCTNGLGCTGQGDRDLLDFFTIQIAPDGRAAIAYSADGATDTTKAMFVLQSDGPRSR